jgi:hypothetical protein
VNARVDDLERGIPSSRENRRSPFVLRAARYPKENALAR